MVAEITEKDSANSQDGERECDGGNLEVGVKENAHGASILRERVTTRHRRRTRRLTLTETNKLTTSRTLDGSLYRSRLLAATIRYTIPRPPRPPQPPPAPTTAEAAVALLRSARPDLLAQGALPAPTSVPPHTLPPQPPVDDLLDFDK
ncbi:hypothetical protein HPB52_011557 [Rhipicephalus sanguineus]|uniref:Uncharacterized protein n=1 Tax=Rhipicephalus sanguineus TaxID=34632 RepID=A0A9D4Q240_RHISA|nr:hypothetical protein HPB52_011557 [Rhipicephalus sanguineus]